MNTNSSRLPLIPGILLGALLGALALNLLLSLPDLFFRFAQVSMLEMRRELKSAVYDAFTTPWGAIGALIGGTMAWKRLRALPESAAVLADSRRVFYPGEAMLALGFVCLLASFALYPSVITWIFALWTLPLAGAFLLYGVFRARDSSASASEQFAGFGLLLLGIVVLGVAALAGTTLSYRLALHSYDLAHQIQRPTGSLPGVVDWAKFTGICLVPVCVIGPGLRLWTDWSSRRQIGWCIVILLFPLAALMLHRTLAAIGFLTLTA